MRIITIFIVTVLIILGFFIGYAIGHTKKRDKGNSKLKW